MILFCSPQEFIKFDNFNFFFLIGHNNNNNKNNMLGKNGENQKRLRKMNLLGEMGSENFKSVSGGSLSLMTVVAQIST